MMMVGKTDLFFRIVNVDQDGRVSIVMRTSMDARKLIVLKELNVLIIHHHWMVQSVDHAQMALPLWLTNASM
jgi:hypothetical protein